MTPVLASLLLVLAVPPATIPYTKSGTMSASYKQHASNCRFHLDAVSQIWTADLMQSWWLPSGGNLPGMLAPWIYWVSFFESLQDIAAGTLGHRWYILCVQACQQRCPAYCVMNNDLDAVWCINKLEHLCSMCHTYGCCIITQLAGVQWIGALPLPMVSCHWQQSP